MNEAQTQSMAPARPRHAGIGGSRKLNRSSVADQVDGAPLPARRAPHAAQMNEIRRAGIRFLR